jgi:hypothetical protein
MHFSKMIQREKTKQGTVKPSLEEDRPNPKQAHSTTGTADQASILHLQQTHGNAYVRRYLASAGGKVQRDGGDASTVAALDAVEDATLDNPGGANRQGLPEVENASQPMTPGPAEDSETGSAPSPSGSEQLLESIDSA